MQALRAMVDPRVACLLMKRPLAFQRAKAREQARAMQPGKPERTYQFTPRGDVDVFVKFFSGDTTPKPEPEE